jgi:heterodisulfide reductase subunit A
MAQIIKQKKLNRVVVAACTPKTHEPLFQETLMAAGLNKYLFEMANIRNHDSWVHKNNPTWPRKRPRTWCAWRCRKIGLDAALKEAELAGQPDGPGHRRRYRRYGGSPQPGPDRATKPIW